MGGERPEICGVAEFIRPRQQLVDSGELASFEEVEVAEITEVFGNVAHRFSHRRPPRDLDAVRTHPWRVADRLNGVG